MLAATGDAMTSPMSRCVFVLAVALTVVLFGCDSSPKWQGWVYPDKNSLTGFEALGSFQNFAMCRDAAQARLVQMKDPDQATFVCGFNCRADESFGGQLVCDETRR
jgi:hypothetical protein